MTKEFRDHKQKRPALDQLLKAYRQRRVDVVLAWRLDHLWRSLKHLIMMLDEFKNLGLAFVALHEQIDCTTELANLCCISLGRLLNLNEL